MLSQDNSIAQGVRWLLKMVILPFKKIANADTSKPGVAVPLIFIQLIAIVALLGYISGYFDREPDVPELIEQMEFESLRGLEYFNSAAFDKILSQNDSLTTKQLVKAIEKPNRRYLLPLLALHELEPEQFDSLEKSLSVGILTDALKQDQTFNDWGRPDLYKSKNREELEAPVAAMIDLGKKAAKGLEQILWEERKAPLWGSQEGLPKGIDPYQVNDYAIALIYKSDPNLALPDSIAKGEFPETRSCRNKLLNAYIKAYVKPDTFVVFKPDTCEGD